MQTIGIIKACNIATKENIDIREFLISNYDVIEMDYPDNIFVVMVIGVGMIIKTIRGLRK